MLNVFPVEPEHSFAGSVIAPGVEGAVVGVMLPVVEAALVPHALVAVTDTVPAPVPIVIVAEAVVPPAVTAHPVPVTDHVYEVAPATGAILNVFPVEPEHSFAGSVIVPGVEGAVVGVISPVV